MAEKSTAFIEISDSSPSSPYDIQPVVCLKNKEEIRKVEAKEDCFILEFDPDEEELNLSKLSISDNSDSDLQFVAQKGQIACRDYSHPRHSCARFPFKTTPHDTHCEMCYCYVCDLPAPCKTWVGGTTSHCDAFDNERWTDIRKSMRQTDDLQIKIAARRHWRHECDKYPYGTTSYRNHCELCDCYVCKVPAPCRKWVAGHCHAFRSRTALPSYQQTELVNQDAKVCVENLPRDINSKELAQIFEKAAGVVKVCKVVYDRETHQSRGYAYVTMGSVEEAEEAISCNGSHLRSRCLSISKAIPNPRISPEARFFNKIYVGNLAWSLDVKLVEETFREHGDAVGYKVVNAEIVRDKYGWSLGYGNVLVMSSEYGMEDVIIVELSGRILGGRAIRVGIYE